MTLKNFKPMRKHIYRSSITGKIVSKKYALANPDTTTKETVCNLRQELIDFMYWFDKDDTNVFVGAENLVNEYLNQK